jgi:hypothetical protein
MPGFESPGIADQLTGDVSLCPRCGTPIPPGLLVCPCFAQTAEEETLNNAARQYKAGEITLTMPGSGGEGDASHILIPGKGRAFCGGKFSKKNYLSIDYDWWVKMIHCEKCEAEIERRGS